MVDKIKGFISFADEDKLLQGELRNHLNGLREQVTWSDHISADFIGSDYINSVEAKAAMERVERGEACVIPILLRDVFWEDQPYANLQYLPKNGKFIKSQSNRDSVFREVVEDIKETIAGFIENHAELQATSDELIPAEVLHGELLRLDYWEQTKNFQSVMGGNVHVGAFLIYGEAHYEQAWLLHRLVHMLKIKNVDKPFFRYPLDRLACSTTPKRLWDSIGKWLDGSNTPRTPEAIAGEVYDLWQRQSVIFILDGLEKVTEQHIQEVLHSFWGPLMGIINQKAQKKVPHHYLLLFLVDHEGYVENWSINWSERLHLLDPNAPPVNLKKLQKFKPHYIDEWTRIGVGILPLTLTPEEILVEGGVPQVVFQRICDLCNHDWYERESEWLKQYGISR